MDTYGWKRGLVVNLSDHWKIVIAIFFFINLGKQAIGQEINAPPILYLRDRNWRIPETEKVGKILDRVYAEDPDGDELVYGMEQRFSSQPDKFKHLPFAINSSNGEVYLNESLLGHAGENFLIYFTATDGCYTAKTEVFINILKERELHYNFKSDDSTSISNVVRNMSLLLPAFSKLPAVQSIRNQHTPHKNTYLLNNENKEKISTQQILATSHQESVKPTAEVRTKLNPIEVKNVRNFESPVNGTRSVHLDVNSYFNSNITEVNTYTSESGIFYIIVLILSFAITLCVLAFLYIKRWCVFKKIKTVKTSKTITTESKQIYINNEFSNNGRNSVGPQQWSGATALGKFYRPYDQQNAHFSNWRLTDSNQAPIKNYTETNGSDSNGKDSSEKYDILESCYNKWEFPRHRLKFFNILGEGAFGQVWRCEAYNIDGKGGATTVAIKTLKETASDADKKDLLTELEVMKSLAPHINVIRLIGCCTERSPIFVIIEYVNKGTLQSFLRNSRAERNYGNTHGASNILTSEVLTSFMYQVAKGMEYLTSQGIIHRDLAARNILITDDHICKIADFGFARDVLTSKIYERKSEGKLPIRWMAIESLFDNIFSAKSDVWSFGILMWEIVTLGSTPYPGISASDVMRKLRNGERLEKPEHCRRELYNIMYYCWSQEPEERPTFTEIVQILEKLLQTELDYIQLDSFPDHNYYNIVNLSNEKL